VPQRPRCASIQRKKRLLTSIGEAVYQAEPFRHLNLRFRALPDALVEDAAIEASDLCLILADSVHLQRKGIYVNSNVRTVHSEHEIASARKDFPSRNALLLGYWFSRKDWLVALFVSDEQAQARRAYKRWRTKLARIVPTSIDSPDESMCGHKGG
jgi:hypothetical protein